MPQVELGQAEVAREKRRLVPRRVARLFSNPLAGVFAALVLIFVASCFLSPYFLTPFNMLIVSRALAFVGMVTIAQALLMIMGELDLSLGAIGGLCGVLGGIMMVELGWDPFLAFGLCLLFGVLFGLVNGLLVTVLGLNSLVVTIGMAGVYSGLNLVITRGLAITGIPDSIGFLGKGVYLGVPMPFVITLVLLALLTVVTQKTPFGRYVYALGNSTAAARMLGIPVGRIRVACFMIAGFCASLAGMLMVARLGTAQPSIGEIWVMPSIAGSVIGGVATTGGIGSLLGAIVGAAIIGVIQNIIVLFGVAPYWQSVVSGAIVVLAISFDAVSRRYIKKE
ncbi:ABC transporter permease [Anaeromyxobacter oryzae]|uniref:ABC transporter permease n=1 Tax=Anaeromyxobacter oryzae TaxID=2918170 RepID=UPI0020C07BA6|nr:ABC transporter permease [Anaeromyxobacter oryzae]